MTLFLHFAAGAILPLVVYILLVIPTTVEKGEIIRWVFTIFPTFDVCMSIILSTCASSIADARQLAIENYDADLEPYNPDIWAWTNLTSNAVIMVIVTFVSIIALILIESDICVCLRTFTFRSLPPEKTINELS